MTASVQQVALDRALALLKAAGVKYAVRLPDGEVVGELPVGKNKTDRKMVNNFTERFPGYPDQIRAMQPGDVLRWDAGTKEYAEAFRASVGSVARIAHGKGNCISTVADGHIVELLRVK